MRRRFLKSKDVPNNRIYYLTSDMQKITVRLNPSIGETTSDYGFGSPMVSNEFDGEKFIITCLSNITQIGCYSFNSTNLINIQIPNSVISIESYAFSDCSNLTSIQIPDSVTSIGGGAFRNCSKLTSVEIPNNIVSIEHSAFQSCTSLTDVVIGNSVTSIGENAFYDCSSLSSVYIKATTPPTLGNEVFYMNASGRKIYVPRASLDAYKTANRWSNYASAIMPYDY